MYIYRYYKATLKKIELRTRWIILIRISSFLFQKGFRLLEKKKLEKTLIENFYHSTYPTNLTSVVDADEYGQRLRKTIQSLAGLQSKNENTTDWVDSFIEISFLYRHATTLRPYFKQVRAKRVLYAGQSYYNCFYLSRSLRKIGWKADVLNWDTDINTNIYYHGEDFNFSDKKYDNFQSKLQFYLNSVYHYDIFHFSNKNGISFGPDLKKWFFFLFDLHAEIYLLKNLGKITSYSNNSCNDGVMQSTFQKWGPESVCSICKWRTNKNVCHDPKNKIWGKFRNSVIDYQILTGGNRADFNLFPTIHETPQFYCLNPRVWNPSKKIPKKYIIRKKNNETVLLYHSVGNRSERTSLTGINIKSSHVYLPLIEKMKRKGRDIELLTPSGIPNKLIIHYQNQADIFLDMLTFGWFGANAREGMLLGKPVVCFIRPEWLLSLRKEIPEYADELPIISATPDTVENILEDLIKDKKRRQEIGKKSRKFALKWHSDSVAAKKFNHIYNRLLVDNHWFLEKS